MRDSVPNICNRLYKSGVLRQRLCPSLRPQFQCQPFLQCLPQQPILGMLCPWKTINITDGIKIRPTTTTALCPKPSKSMTCGKEGLGYQMYQLGQLEPEVSSPENCHQLCLQNPACKSYQIPRGRWTNCFTFNVTAGPEGNYVNATQLTGFGSPPPFPLTYDRGCPDHLLVSRINFPAM